MAGNLDRLKPIEAKDILVTPETIENDTVVSTNAQGLLEEQETKIIYGGSY